MRSRTCLHLLQPHKAPNARGGGRTSCARAEQRPEAPRHLFLWVDHDANLQMTSLPVQGLPCRKLPELPRQD